MMGRKLNAMLGVLGGAAIWSPPALAHMTHTPHGPVDSHCVVEVPNGAHTNLKTGEVRLDGELVMTIGHDASCGKGAIPNGFGTGVNGNEIAVAAYAANYDGITEFYQLSEEWVVPSKPVNDTNNSVSFLWMGLQQCPTGGCEAVLQPVLGWNGDGSDDHLWQISSWYVDDTGTHIHSGFETVDVDDEILGFVVYDGTYNEWVVWTEDVTSGAYTYEYFSEYYDTFWNLAFTGDLEAYGTSAQTAFPASCNDLPSSDNEYFHVTVSWQFGAPGGSGGIGPVTLSQEIDPESQRPSSCAWGLGFGTTTSGTFNGDQYAHLVW